VTRAQVRWLLRLDGQWRSQGQLSALAQLRPLHRLEALGLAEHRGGFTQEATDPREYERQWRNIEWRLTGYGLSEKAILQRRVK
jgi:hypothetical protein